MRNSEGSSVVSGDALPGRLAAALRSLINRTAKKGELFYKELVEAEIAPTLEAHANNIDKEETAKQTRLAQVTARQQQQRNPFGGGFHQQRGRQQHFYRGF